MEAGRWAVTIPVANPALPKVCISAASPHSKAVQDLLDWLPRLGFAVRGGPLMFAMQPTAAEREAWVRECDVLLPVVTDDYSRSPWAREELQLALQCGKAIGPVWHSGPYPPPLFVELGVRNAPIPHNSTRGYLAGRVPPDVVAGQVAAALAPDHFYIIENSLRAA
jgi:hypothetical protein